MRHLASYTVNLLCTCLLLVCFVCLSCKKFISVDPPLDKIIASDVFRTNETATAAVVGLYAQLMPPVPYFASGGSSVYAGLSADELAPTNTSTTDLEFFENSLLPTNSVVRQNFWLPAYKVIYQANACLEGLQASSTLPSERKQQLGAEARFVRAYCYFHLVNLFGDVPLITSTDYRQNAVLARTPASQVWSQIQSDLKEAKENLPEAYPSAERVRPNKWAAAALLARVYLYRKEWAAAEAEATAVITSGLYALEPDLRTVFLAGSSEAIWQLMPVEAGFNTTEAQAFVPSPYSSSPPNYVLTPDLLAAFEPGDERRKTWVGTVTSGSETFAFPYKYKVQEIGLPVTEYYTALRLAEQLLIRAEARAEQNKLTDALSDLNQIRERAGLPDVAVQTQAGLLTAIAQERRIELFAEWGHRWFDLKRTGQVQAVLAAAKPTWRPGAELYPIPENDLLLNPSLDQNPGY